MTPVRLWTLVTLAGAALTACSQSESGTGSTQKGLVVHEWGTFTSVQSSLGKTMAGLHHTDEVLPQFVHARGGGDAHKGIEALPEPVTQKLETPVLYFYGDSANVKVTVDFPRGVISEWFPAAKTFTPEIDRMTRIAQGSMTWEASLTPAEAALQVPVVAPDSVWQPSREVAAQGVRIGAEQERFIFYRGVGVFELPVRIETAPGGDLRITNDSDQRIPAAFLLHVHDGGGAVAELGALGPRQSLLQSPTPKERDVARYVETASAALERSLVATGLFPDEARAMVRTWERSYFRSHGLRVLYVVPREWTDALLPIQIEPAPGELVRTLVGRVEVLTVAEEEAILARLKLAQVNGETLRADSFGRFTEAKLRRALELIPPTDTVLHSYTNAVVQAAANMP